MATRLAILIVFSALVTVATLLIRIPNPMGGYFNLGDVMIFVSALTFGPVIGGPNPIPKQTLKTLIFSLSEKQ